MSAQGDAQERFVELEAKWVLWVISHPGWKLRHGEGRILALGPDGMGRKARVIATGEDVRVQDRVHKAGGTHYLGTGADWQLFVDGKWITSSDHPAWVACGEKWEEMGGAWGGRFKPVDSNHISIPFGGMS